MAKLLYQGQEVYFLEAWGNQAWEQYLKPLGLWGKFATEAEYVQYIQAKEERAYVMLASVGTKKSLGACRFSDIVIAEEESCPIIVRRP